MSGKIRHPRGKKAERAHRPAPLQTSYTERRLELGMVVRAIHESPLPAAPRVTTFSLEERSDLEAGLTS